MQLYFLLSIYTKNLQVFVPQYHKTKNIYI